MKFIFMRRNCKHLKHFRQLGLVIFPQRSCLIRFVSVFTLYQFYYFILLIQHKLNFNICNCEFRSVNQVLIHLH